jgi:hypothetical protein
MTFDESSNYMASSYYLGAMYAEVDELDQDTYQHAAAKLASGALIPDSSGHTGDVSWSPPFAFRSRFFAIYVLGQGLELGVDERNPMLDQSPNLSRARVVGERRIEAIYDALLDKMLFKRQPVSEKRSLSGGTTGRVSPVE